MKAKPLASILLAFMLTSGCTPEAPTPSKRPEGKGEEKAEKITYNIYLGNTHAHSRYSGDATQENNTPDDHFRLAKQNGYDFYAVTDHSQYEQYSAGAFAQILADADRYTDSKFVGIRGYEHSENNGPDAKGHLNVFSTPTYLNALADGINMQYFQDWICSADNAKAMVCMNHPQDNQYNNFKCYNEGARKKVYLIELINATKCNDHYPGYLAALKNGWKVSPVAGMDNHSTNKISSWPARTGVLAKSLTRSDIFDAFAARRTFAVYDKTTTIYYYADNHVMGSSFHNSSGTLSFEIHVSSRNVRIDRVDICTENGTVVKSEKFDKNEVTWEPEVTVGGKKYFFVNAYSKDGPLAYAAPVWLN